MAGECNDPGPEAHNAEPVAPPVRYHALDGLRATAMLLGIVLHGVMAYQTTLSWVWIVQDDSRSVVADWIFHWIHCFRMPLFFLLSGFLARLVFQRVGYREFVKRRWRRVGLPLLVGVLTLMPAAVRIQEYANAKAGPPKIDIFDPAIWADRDAIASDPERLAAALENPNAADKFFESLPEPIKLLRYTILSYLWFLYYLMVFFLVVPLLAQWAPGVIRTGPTLVRWVDSLMGASLRGWTAPLPLAIVTLPFWLLQWSVHSWSLGTPFAAFMPFPLFLLGFLELNMIGLYGLFFSFGWLLNRQPHLISHLAPKAYAWLAIGTLAWIIAHTLSAIFVLKTSHPHWGIIRTLTLFVYGLASCTLCVGFIGVFQRLFSQDNARWRYMADASYFIYLAHLPLIILLQMALTRWEFSWVMKFSLLCAITTAVLTLAYHTLVRYTWIGRFLNGLRKTAGRVPGE